MSRTIAVVIAFLVGSLMGCGITSLFQFVEPADRFEMSDSVRLAHASTEQSEVRPDLGEVAPSEPAAARQASLVTDATDETSTSESTRVAREIIAAEPSATGDGVIEGRVTDESGVPIPGATIVATTSGADLAQSHWERSARGRGQPKVPTLEERLAYTRESFRRGQLSRTEATSDSQGQFRLNGLRNVTYQLEGWAEGFVIEPSGETTSFLPGEQVDLIAVPTVDIPMVVYHPDGSPANRASIDLESENTDETISDLWVRETPTIRVARGHYRLHAYARWTRDAGSPPVDTRSEEVEVDLTHGAPSTPIELRLRSRSGIRGKALFGKLTTSSYFTVGVTKLLTEQKIEPRSDLDFDYDTWVSRDDPNFEFLDLEIGRYTLALRSSSSLLASKVVEITAEEVITCDIDTSGFETLRQFSVTATGPRGYPVSGVDFYLRSIDHEGSIVEQNDADEISLGRGSYSVFVSSEFAPKLDNPSANSRVVLIAHSSHFGTLEQGIDSRTRAVELRFPEPATLSLQIIGYDALTIKSSLQLTIQGTGSSAHPWRNYVEIDSQGQATFGPVVPGVYQVVLEMDHEGWGNAVLVNSAMTLVAGENKSNLPIPPLYTLQVHLPGLTSGWVQIKSEFGDGRSYQLEEDRISIANLIAGNYTISCSSEEPSDRVLQIRIPDSLSVILPKTEP